jgi:hypothetical protein
MPKQFKEWMRYVETTSALLASLGTDSIEPIMMYDEFKAKIEPRKPRRQR